MSQGTSSQCTGCSLKARKIYRSTWIILSTGSLMTVPGCVLPYLILRGLVETLIIISNFIMLIGTITDTKRFHLSLIMLQINIQISLIEGLTPNMLGRATISFKIGWQMLCLKMKLEYGTQVLPVCSFLAKASLLCSINTRKLRTISSLSLSS